MDMIETKALEFAYPAEEGEKPVLALRGVDTAIEKGSFVVVLGHNGSGKSTFAKCLNAILLPCGGKVYVEGMDTQDEAAEKNVGPEGWLFFTNSSAWTSLCFIDSSFIISNISRCLHMMHGKQPTREKPFLYNGFGCWPALRIQSITSREVHVKIGLKTEASYCLHHSRTTFPL